MHCFKMMSLRGHTDVAGGCFRPLGQSVMGKMWGKDKNAAWVSKSQCVCRSMEWKPVNAPKAGLISSRSKVRHREAEFGFKSYCKSVPGIEAKPTEADVKLMSQAHLPPQIIWSQERVRVPLFGTQEPPLLLHTVPHRPQTLWKVPLGRWCP